METVYFDKESGIGEEVVHAGKLSEIPKGITQCKNHTWRKLSENELFCGTCDTAIIVNHDVLEEML